MGQLNGKTALVTGASRGIGRAIAIALAEAGANVVVNYANNQDAAGETVEQIKKTGVKSACIKADVKSPEDVKQLFSDAQDAVGPIDILVNNAGIIRHSPLAFLSDQDWQEVINTNLTGSFTCIRQASRNMMKAKWGRIINISSDAGRAGETMAAHYSASKAGILGLTKSTARDLAPYGITVNAITPGFIETEMTASTNESIKEKQLAMIPVKSFGQAEDVANLAVFLATDQAKYITGQTISVDGGLFMG